MSNVALFSWLAGAEFYEGAHAQAVALVPMRAGRWLDAGSGPGLVARLAAERGFEVTVSDRSLEMVRAAEREFAARRLRARFVRAAFDELPAEQFDVVSAASLIAVLPDRRRALETLWRHVAPGGALLLVETTARMRPVAAMERLRGRRAAGLMLWALARRGSTAAPDLDAFSPPGATRTSHELLGGLLGAWLFRRQGATP